MRRTVLLLALYYILIPASQAQFTLQNSNSTADLRGIHSIGNGVAWASGTHGTVLRTEDSGFVWQSCAIPPGAEKLDFRGIQAFDANTAIVMSSGPGDQSRLYKTTDGCHTWKLVLANPYFPDGFFDAILFLDARHGILFGDPSPLSLRTPVEGANDFRIRVTADGGLTWGPVSAPDTRQPGVGLHASGDESAFAASNSSIASRNGWFWFATSSGRVASRMLYTPAQLHGALFQSAFCAGQVDPISDECGQPWTDFLNATVPITHTSPSSGIFSLHFKDEKVGIAVGGDFLKPDMSVNTAALTRDGGKTWQAAQTMPHGYRSSVDYDSTKKLWIAVGPNGTDLSPDEGKNWLPVHPSTSLHEPEGSDKHWNALSLPFVVGPKGRIGKLDPGALKP